MAARIKDIKESARAVANDAKLQLVLTPPFDILQAAANVKCVLWPAGPGAALTLQVMQGESCVCETGQAGSHCAS